VFWYLQTLLSTPRRLSENKNEDICVVEYTNENRDKVIIFNTTGSVKCSSCSTNGTRRVKKFFLYQQIQAFA
jgi:hypothetical protein